MYFEIRIIKESKEKNEEKVQTYTIEKNKEIENIVNETKSKVADYEQYRKNKEGEENTPKKMKPLSNEEKETLIDTDQRIGMKKGTYMNLDEIGNMFDIQYGNERILFKKRENGEYHIHNRKSSKQYIILYPQKGIMETHEGKILKIENISQDICKILGIEKEINIKIINRTLKGGKEISSLAIISEEDNFLVWNAGKISNENEKKELADIEGVFVQDEIKQGERGSF